uniref:Coiled-coil domain containing 103 n=2 Tax=Bos TaxID=9903 RepID=A0A3Q1M4P2_BOVIN
MRKLQKYIDRTKEVAQVPRDLCFSLALDRGICKPESLSPFLCRVCLISCSIIASGFGWKVSFLLKRHLRMGASLVAQMVKNLPAVWETRVGSLDGEHNTGEGNGNPLQYSCLENSMDRAAFSSAGAMKRNDVINFKALEKELQAALIADEKYKRENAAKLRAVEQKVASYEEFRGIVLASHLKPLEQKDKMGGKRPVPWNCHTSQGRPFQDESNELSLEKTLFQPETSAEFYRDWRRHLRSGPERYEALLQLGGPKLGRLFQMDVGFGLLGEMLVALADHVRPADCRAVLGILHSLASTGRFTLNLSLMSRAERESCRALFQKLQAMGTPSSEGQGLGEQPGGLQEEEGLLQELLMLYHVD